MIVNTRDHAAPVVLGSLPILSNISPLTMFVIMPGMVLNDVPMAKRYLSHDHDAARDIRRHARTKHTRKETKRDPWSGAGFACRKQVQYENRNSWVHNARISGCNAYHALDRVAVTYGLYFEDTS